jgi:hypothetical protein
MTIYLLTQAQRDLIATETLQPTWAVYDEDPALCRYFITDDLVDPATLAYDSIVTYEEAIAIQLAFKIQFFPA